MEKESYGGFSIYPSKKLKKEILIIAKKENRNLNGQIIKILEDYIQSQNQSKKERERAKIQD